MRDFEDYAAARMDRWRRTAYLLTRDWHRADDLVSVLVGKMYSGWRRIKAMDNVDAYAHRVLTNAWLDEHRRPWRREKLVPIPDSALIEPPTGVDDRQMLWQMLGALGKRQRAVIVLRFYLGYSVEETAEILGISAGTVKSQSARGLQTLRTLTLHEVK